MNETQTQHSPLEDADALIIALQSQRFVIVRKDEPKRLYPDPICKRIRDLKPGDAVHYQGTMNTVCGVLAY